MTSIFWSHYRMQAAAPPKHWRFLLLMFSHYHFSPTTVDNESPSACLWLICDCSSGTLVDYSIFQQEKWLSQEGHVQYPIKFDTCIVHNSLVSQITQTHRHKCKIVHWFHFVLLHWVYYQALYIALSSSNYPAFWGKFKAWLEGRIKLLQRKLAIAWNRSAVLAMHPPTQDLFKF